MAPHKRIRRVPRRLGQVLEDELSRSHPLGQSPNVVLEHPHYAVCGGSQEGVSPGLCGEEGGCAEAEAFEFLEGLHTLEPALEGAQVDVLDAWGGGEWGGDGEGGKEENFIS